MSGGPFRSFIKAAHKLSRFSSLRGKFSYKFHSTTCLRQQNMQENLYLKGEQKLESFKSFESSKTISFREILIRVILVKQKIRKISANDVVTNILLVLGPMASGCLLVNRRQTNSDKISCTATKACWAANDYLIVKLEIIKIFRLVTS